MVMSKNAKHETPSDQIINSPTTQFAIIFMPPPDTLQDDDNEPSLSGGVPVGKRCRDLRVIK